MTKGKTMTKGKSEMTKGKSENPRREFVKKSAYIAPAILTLAVTPSYAKVGSIKPLPTPTPLPTDPTDTLS